MSGECNRCGEHCIECRCRPGDVADLSICRRRQSDRPVGDDELVRFLRHQAFAASQTSHARARKIGLRLAEAADRITDLQTRLERHREALVDLVDALRGDADSENGLSARACFELEAASKALSDGGIEG